MKPNSTLSHQDTQQSHSFDHYYYLFKRAKTESTLTVMYEGAVTRAKRELKDRELTLALIQVERALDRCQQDFDTTVAGMTRKANHSSKAIAESTKPYDPAEEMAKLLAGM